MKFSWDQVKDLPRYPRNQWPNGYTRRLGWAQQGVVILYVQETMSWDGLGEIRWCFEGRESTPAG